LSTAHFVPIKQAIYALNVASHALRLPVIHWYSREEETI